MSTGRRYNLLFGALEGTFWAAYNVVYAFMVTILTSYGFSTGFCGILSTLLAMGAILAQPVVGYISDTFLPGKRLLVICLTLSAGAILFFPKIMTMSPWLVMLCFFVYSLFNYTFSTIIDVWAIRFIPENPGMDFAVLRSGGSLLYAVAGLVAGGMVAKLGVQVLFYAHAVLLIITVIIALQIPEAACQNLRGKAAKDGQEGMSLGSAISLLMKNRPYVVFMVVMVCYQFSTRIISIYLATLVEVAGGTSAHFGIALFVGSMGEIVAMAVVSRLLFHGVPLPYVAIGFMGMLFVRFFLLNFNLGIWFLIGFQFLYALASGTQIRIYTEYIADITPHAITATATNFATAVYLGLGGMVGNLVGGFVIETAGVATFANLCAGMQVLSFLIFLPTVWGEHRRRVAQNETNQANQAKQASQAGQASQTIRKDGFP